MRSKEKTIYSRQYAVSSRGFHINFVVVENYVYLVTHIIEKDFFIKTIIPSQKATKDYFKERKGLS